MQPELGGTAQQLAEFDAQGTGDARQRGDVPASLSQLADHIDGDVSCYYQIALSEDAPPRFTDALTDQRLGHPCTSGNVESWGVPRPTVMCAEVNARPG